MKARDRMLAGKLLAMAAAMFGFGFLLVPLYDVFCEITGIGVRTGTPTAAAVAENPVTDRRVTVEFVATRNQQAPWEFRPQVASMEIVPGKLYDTSYFARNLTRRQLVGQAVPSVAPGEANRYLKKTECFCFQSQTFGPEESRDMGITFMIDPEMPDYIDRVTLSYTFFVNQQVAGQPADDSNPGS
jgi:cytochrome c oxidase assembly protein subunit 11